MPYKNKERQQEYQRQWQIRHVASGLCFECSRPLAETSKQYCLFHLDRHRRANRKYYNNPERHDGIKAIGRTEYQKQKEENKCVDCSMPLDDDSRCGTRCLNCATAKNDCR